MPRLDADLSDVKDEDMGGGSWRALEPGEYVFHVTSSEYKRTKAGNGWVLKLVWDCIQPGHRAQIWDFLTLEHPNSETVRIARAKLKEVAIAVGHPNPDYIQASEELHMKPCILKVKKVRNEQFGDERGFKNEILGYKPMDGAPRSAPPAQYDADEPPPHGDEDGIQF